MPSLGSIEFASPEALLLLLLLPLWWWWRRQASPASIRFSRTGVLAAGPAHGRFVRRALLILRNLLLVALIVALARPEPAREPRRCSRKGST